MVSKVIFVALTYYQLYISDLYASYIINTKKNIDVLVVAVGLSIDEFCDNVEYKIFSIPEMNKSAITRIWQRLYWGGNLFFLTDLKKQIFGKKIALFVFNDNEPITNKIIRAIKKNSDKNVVTIIEEGIGIYSYTNKHTLNIKEKIRLLVTTILGSPMQYKAIGDNALIDCAIVGNVELYKSLNKASVQELFLQSKAVLYDNADIFLKHYSQNHLNSTDVDFLYLGQPFDEYGNLIEEEKKCIEKIISALGPSKKILIKPHPRDAECKYDCFNEKYDNVFLMSNEMARLPIECLIGGLNIGSVISFNSSAGINIANTFKKIKCIFFIKADFAESLKKYWNKIGAIYSDDIYRSLNDNVFFLESLEGISKITKENEVENFNVRKKEDKEKMYFKEIDEIFNLI